MSRAIRLGAATLLAWAGALPLHAQESHGDAATEAHAPVQAQGTESVEAGGPATADTYGQAEPHGAGDAHGGHGEGEVDLGYMIMHHLVDAHEMTLPFVGTVHLPEWEPVRVGGLEIDLSPTKHVVLLLLAALIVALGGILVSRTITRKYRDRAPSGFANASEAMILYFRDEVIRRNIGHGADAFAPLILTLFFFILVMNLLGLVPYGGSATGNLAVTGGLALVAFIVIEAAGFAELGPKGYAKTIFFAPEGMHPVGKALMLVIMTPVEFLGKLTKPFALAVRLFANMTAGHTLILALGGLIFVFMGSATVMAGVGIASTLMGAAIMILEVFVAFLQAYIFAMLTAVFIGLIRHAH